MTYRDDDRARAERASSLIDEIAELERQKLGHAVTDQRLEQAKHELSALHATAPVASAGRPGLLAHLLVFGAAASAAYLGYTVLA